MINDSIGELSFERALEQLEAVVRELESPETGLDKSLARYEDGVRLLKRCRAILDDAERKIRLLTRIDANGSPVTDAFDVPADNAAELDEPREPIQPMKRTTTRATKRLTEPADRGEQLF